MQFTVFSLLCAFATCAYHAQLVVPFDYDFHTLALIAAVAVLLKPSSARRFLALMAAQTVAIYQQMPQINTNHIVTFFVGVTVIASAATLLVRTRSVRLDTQRWIELAAPQLRLVVLVVYFFTLWHKLNADFLDPTKSCGVALYGQLQEAVPALPRAASQAWIGRAAIYATLAIEGAIPVLLIARRTRTAAALSAFAFHFVLGLGGFYSFSATMVALLSLFVPPEALERACIRASARAKLVKTLAIAALAIALVVFVARHWNSAMAPLANVNRIWAEECDLLFWRIWWLAPLGVAWLSWKQRGLRVEQPPARALLRLHPAGALIPLCVFVNGLCPYLGLKTETSFAMYSNLRTEGGGTNHLLIPRPLSLADYQTDLVRILRAPDGELAEAKREDRPIPFVELRRRVQELAANGERYIGVTYVRGGVTHRIVHAENDPELAAPLTYCERKFLVFRRILLGDANTCEH